MKFELLILGSNSALPAYGRHPTAQLIRFYNDYLLIDCGEGTQMQLQSYGVKVNRISTIFISHLHGDHFFGLIGLISTMNHLGRSSPLVVFGPADLEEILRVQFEASKTLLGFSLQFKPLNHDLPAVIMENDRIEVRSFPLNHRVSCTGFRFNEKNRPLKLIKEKVKKDQVPVSFMKKLKAGEDCSTGEGKTYFSADYTLPGPSNRSYAYCSDTMADESYEPYIQKVDVLYHEATFLHELLSRAVQTKHSTALQAAEVAKRVQAKQLLIGHFSSRYENVQPLLTEAKKVFPQALCAEEGKWFEIGN